jgi:oxygen-independent coproporphyrinogen-3 oxidase
MSPSQVERLLDILRAGLCFAPDIEITLEGNPHEFSQEYLDAVRLSGVTRVSIGYQSSQDAVLREMLNSPHTANESLSALKNALSAGFQTVNVDLLYRLPGQTFAQWQYDIEVVLGLGPTSVTTYEYIIHERTTSARRIADGRMQTPANKSEALSWYQWVRSRMLSSGYIEPTNHTFAKPGHAQRYSDLTYGQGTELIGLGVKAYSYVNGYQLMAPKTVPTYEKAINEDLFPITHMSPAPSRRNLMERYVIFSLRRGFGVSKHVFVERFGANLEEVFDPQLKRLSDNGTLRINESKIELSDLGREWKYNVLEAFYDPAYL